MDLFLVDFNYDGSAVILGWWEMIYSSPKMKNCTRKQQQLILKEI